MNDFLLKLKLINPTSVIDCYAQLNIVCSKCSRKGIFYVLLGIGAPQAARKVNYAYQELLLARNIATRKVKRARLSAIFRKNMNIKGKTDRTRSRWLERKVTRHAPFKEIFK